MKIAFLHKLQPAALALVFAPVLSCPVWAPATVAAQQSAARSDGQIEMDVVQALDDSQALKNDLITAATIQGKVTLSGTVASQANKDLAASIVAKVQGVSGVVNNLKVGDPAAAAQAENLPAPGDDQPDQQMQQQANSAPASQPDGQSAPQADPNYGQSQPQPNYPQQPNSPQQPAYPQQPGYPQQGGNYPPPPPRQPYQPGYGPGYPPPPPGYGEQPYAAAPSFNLPSGPVTLLPGTVLQLRTTDNVDSKRATPRGRWCSR